MDRLAAHPSDGSVWIAHRTIAAPEPTDFEQLSVRELRRNLAALNVNTSGREDPAALLETLRFQVDCQDAQFDSALMPRNIRCHQMAQAVFLLMLYYYAPVTRALETLFLCRELAGSGDPHDQDPAYQVEYLKDDLQVSIAYLHARTLTLLPRTTIESLG
jgi:hypothetical protein